MIVGQSLTQIRTTAPDLKYLNRKSSKERFIMFIVNSIMMMFTV